MAIYIALIHLDPGVLEKLCTKHNVTEPELRNALQWPAKVRAAFEEDPEHGPRWVAYAAFGDRELFAALIPLPDWEGEDAEVWCVKTAWWLG